MSNLPPVEQLPVLTGLRKEMDLDLVVNPDGKLFVLFDGEIPEKIEYAAYNANNSSLTFITVKGRLQDIGMTIQKPMIKFIMNAQQLHLIKMQSGQAVWTDIIPLVLIGL